MIENEEDASVVPLHNLAVVDTKLDRVRPEDLVQSGLVNLWSDGKEGGYAVQHGRKAISDFPPREGEPDYTEDYNFWERAFPMLFPYGTGGMERRREVSIGLGDHVNWASFYYDHRFEEHSTYGAVAFSCLQRRQALNSARIQANRASYFRHAGELSSLTVEDLVAASKEEEQGGHSSNRTVQQLKQQVFATSSHVMGSDASRMRARRLIKATTIKHNPPSIWMTINPDDLHSPIAQVSRFRSNKSNERD